MRPARSRCRTAGRSPSYSDITYAFNGGKSRYKSLQAKWEWRVSRDVTLLNSLTLSEAKDNGAQSLENSNGNFPAPQDFRNLDADFGLSNYHQPYNNTTSFVWALPFGEGRRWLSAASPVVNAIAGGWELAGINSIYAGEPITFQYNAGPTFVVSGIAQDFRGANNYRPNVTCDPMAPEGERTISQLVQPRVRVGADRPQPAVRERGAQLGARDRSSGSSTSSPRSGWRSAARRSWRSASRPSTR